MSGSQGGQSGFGGQYGNYSGQPNNTTGFGGPVSGQGYGLAGAAPNFSSPAAGMSQASGPIDNYKGYQPENITYTQPNDGYKGYQPENITYTQPDFAGRDMPASTTPTPYQPPYSGNGNMEGAASPAGPGAAMSYQPPMQQPSAASSGQPTSGLLSQSPPPSWIADPNRQGGVRPWDQQYQQAIGQRANFDPTQGGQFYMPDPAYNRDQRTAGLPQRGPQPNQQFGNPWQTR